MSGALIRVERVRAAMRLVREAHELGLGTENARVHMATGLAAILGAELGAIVKDDAFGPGLRGGINAFTLVGFDESTLKVFTTHHTEGSDFNPYHREAMRVLAGTSEPVLSRRNVDIVEKKAWQRSAWVNEYVRPARLDHFLGSMRRLASSKIEGFGFMRAARSKPFSDEDRELLELVHVGVGRVFDDSFADLKLAPRVRETLEAMLSGAAQDKEIAARLGISPHTVREYVKTIYKTYRVSSRGELLSRFVRR